MSYSFTMSFKEIEKEKLLDYISEITNICINNSKEIIKENINLKDNNGRLIIKK